MTTDLPPPSHAANAPDAPAAGPFLALSRRVERRLTLARWLRALRASGLPLFVLLTAGLGAAWSLGLTHLPLVARAVLPTAVTLVLAWAAGCALWARLRMPTHAAALALFDERSHNHEMFVSAYSLAHDPPPDTACRDGAQLHLARAHAALAEATEHLDQAVPVRAAPVVIWLPALFVLAASCGLPAAAGIPPEDDATQQAAAVGASLDEEAKTLERLARGLSPEEQEKLAQLKEKLQDSAQKMANLQQEKSARDVLEELEQRAREAEKLADMLGAGKEDIGSAMLAELERHADTAELAGSLRGRKLGEASTEAGKLARRLRAEDLSREARKRLENAFEGGLEAATPQDLKTLLGTHMTVAQSELDQDRPERAAQEFERLARRYQKMSERVRSMETLKRLAQNLRASGQKALGHKQGAMTSLARLGSGTRTGPPGLTTVGRRPAKLALGGAPAVAGKGSGAASAAPGNPTAGVPVPGSAGAAGPSCKGCPNCGRPRPAGPAPIPGTRPGATGGVPQPGAVPGGT